jgi:hypothetical protein
MALGLRGEGKKSAHLMAAFKERNRVTCCSALSREFKWKSREHLSNCRRITEETAGIVDGLLGD